MLKLNLTNRSTMPLHHSENDTVSTEPDDENPLLELPEELIISIMLLIHSMGCFACMMSFNLISHCGILISI